MMWYKKVSGACKYKILSGSAVAAAGLKNKKATNITIPKTVTYGGKSFKVAAIADKAFRRAKIKEVAVGDSVKTIGAYAFEGCSSLRKASLGKNVEKIGKNAFKGCRKLKTVTVKSSRLKSAGAGAFKGIHAKASIKAPKKKLSAYRKILKGKGQGKKVRIVKM